MVESALPSYKKINYGVRPSKHIERKMLIESFRRLVGFGQLETYRYVGLGSIYFTDFVLVHRTLGIHDLVSIERETNDEDRFNFNRPFGCVKIEYGDTSEVLPTLAWDKKTILWLDYDDPLERSHLDDVSTFCALAEPGSLLLVSVNVHPNKRGQANFVENLRARVGDEWLPEGLTQSDLKDEGLGTISRQILAEAIASSLLNRNGGLAGGTRMQFQQLFLFRYRDGAMMMTFGGVILSEDQSAAFADCHFEDLPYVRRADDPYYIDPPHLTLRELKHLDAQLPCSDPSTLVAHGISTEELARYAAVYRYYPSFAEFEL